MNIEVEESLLLFRSGLAGESEPLRKFGIDVSAATVNLVGLEAGLGGANGKLDEGEKVQARYLAIMEQTEKTAGDFANTSDGLANTQRILSAKWQEAQVILGKELAPAMGVLLQAGSDLIPVFILVVGVIADIVKEAQPLFEAVGAIAKFLGDAADASADATEEAGLLEQAWRLLNQAATLVIDPVGSVNREFGMFEEAAEQAAFRLGVVTNKYEGFAERADRAKEIQKKVTATFALGTDATGKYNDVLSATVTRTAEVATESERAAAGIRSILAAQAEAASPALRLLRTQQSLVAAQEKLAETRVDGEASAADLVDAELDLISAQIDLDSAAANLAGRVDESAEAFIRTAIQAGLLRSEALLLAQQLDLIPTTIDVNLRLNLGGLSVGEAANLAQAAVPGVMAGR